MLLLRLMECLLEGGGLIRKWVRVHNLNGTQIQPHQHPLGVREIANNLPDRLGQFAHQRWNGQDLVALGQLRILEQINNLNLIQMNKTQ